MESIGNAYIKGVYQDGSIHSDYFSIRVCPAFPTIGGERLYIGEVYMDALDRPYINVTKECSPEMFGASFINVLMCPKDKHKEIQLVELHDSTKVWVNFKNIQEKCDGYYSCDLEFCDGKWYFVPKGCDSIR
jgi:hypothetical protein